MDYAASFFEGRGAHWNYHSLKNFDTITPPVQHHLCKVYTTLCATVLLSAVGVYIHTLWAIGGLVTSLLFLGAGTWLAIMPATVENETTRLQLLGAAALCEGASVGTLVGQVLKFNPSIVMVAFLGSTAIFACFSGAALLAKRREYLFLGGILSSAISILLLMQFGSIFFGRGMFMATMELYLGLAVFVGYVLFDTQMIIERASLGDFDYIKHALDLFIDFVAIFVRILIILAFVLLCTVLLSCFVALLASTLAMTHPTQAQQTFVLALMEAALQVGHCFLSMQELHQHVMRVAVATRSATKWERRNMRAKAYKARKKWRAQ